MQLLRQQFIVFLEWALLLLLAASILWRGGKGLEATWILGGLAVLLTFMRWGKHSHPAPGVPVDLWAGLMLFLLWSVASYILSKTQNYGLDEIIRDGALVLVLLWVVQRASPRDAPTEPHGQFIKQLITVIALGALFACSIGVAVYVLQPVNRFVGTFFDARFDTDYWPNAWAEFLLLSWPVTVLWMRRFHPAVRTVFTGVLFGSLFLSYSRGAFLVFCGQIVLWGLIMGVRFWASRTRSNRSALSSSCRMIGVGLAILVIAAAFFIGVNGVRSHFHDVESVAAKATFTASEGASSISERSDFWKQSFTLSLQRPVFGWGPYSFRFVQPRLQTKVYATSDHPHNVFLKLAMERGWPAALLFLFILLRILLPAFLSVIRGKGWAEIPLRTVSLIAVTGVFAHNLIDYNLQFVGIALPVWILLGLLVLPVQQKKLSIKCIRTFELLVAVLLGLTLVFEGRFLVLSSLGRHAEVQGDAAAALQWYDRARGELFSRDMSLSKASLLINAGDDGAAARALDDYAAQNQQDARLWILRGRTAEQSGGHQEALRDYSAAFGLAAYDYPEALEGMLQEYSALKKIDVLKEKSEEFERILRAYGDAILHNTHFIALSEAVESFGRVSELLQTLFPAKRAVFRTFAAEVLRHADEERARYAARIPGFLW